MEDRIIAILAIISVCVVVLSTHNDRNCASRKEGGSEVLTQEYFDRITEEALALDITGGPSLTISGSNRKGRSHEDT